MAVQIIFHFFIYGYSKRYFTHSLYFPMAVSAQDQQNIFFLNITLSETPKQEVTIIKRK